LYWGAVAARQAEDAFDLIHKRKEIPEEVAEFTLPADAVVSLPALIRDAGLASSGGEARRLIQQGAVKIDGEKLSDLDIHRTRLQGQVLQVGKRRFVRLVSG
jgi:tyrosyl-tRNA synthetase